MNHQFSISVESEAGTNAQVGQPQAKRQKIQLACKPCRERKTKCDGRKPVCKACEKRHVARSCVYERASYTAQRYISALEDRLNRLEQGVRVENQTTSGTDDQVTESACAWNSGQQSYGILHDDIGTILPNGASSNMPNSAQSIQQRPHHVDALATVGSGDHDDCLYGRSSTIAFVQQVAGESSRDKTPVLGSAFDTRTSMTPAVSGSIALRPLEISRSNDDALTILPLRRHADDFLHCYWEFVHPLFPLLHQKSFCLWYQRLWEPGTRHIPEFGDEAILLSNLNLIFALGCQFSTQLAPARKVSAANEFYQRSRHLLLYDILGSTSIGIVQWLLLSGIYLQSTSHASYCWNSVGLAIRHAQGLGLHLEHMRRKSEQQLGREMRRRVWHTCVVLDRLLAMTFGRPFMVDTTFDTSVPSLIDDEYLLHDGEGFQPPELPSKLSLFVYSCKLFEILADILGKFYTDQSHVVSRGDTDVRLLIPEILLLNRRLDQFMESLPDYLRTSTTTESPGTTMKHNSLHLQQQVLYCRFLYTRVLCLRPLLLRATQTSKGAAPTSTLDGELVRNACGLCIDTAHRLIETIHLHLDTTYRSSGWHSVYFAFAAVTVLLASLKLDGSASYSKTAFQTSWERCLLTMKHYQEQIPTARYAVEVLQTLRQKIEKPRNQNISSDNSDDRGADSLDVGEVTDIGGHQQTTSTLDVSQFNLYNAENLCDAWFSQHIINLDCMDASQFYQ